MKTVLLCGGLGTRLSEETTIKPKPMVEIAGKPILWHIMKIYEHYGFGDFILALGYKGEVIKDYFLNYHARMSDLTVSLKSGGVEYSNPTAEDWRVQLIDTGALTMTGGRLLRLKDHLKETFMVTYGDGVSNVDIQKLLSFHKSHGKLATVTAVRPPVRFGELSISGNQVIRFQEKPQAEEGWINGGFFVFEPEVLNYIADESTMLERVPLEALAQAGELMAYHHHGYWQCMDTLRDKHTLEELWLQNKAPWKLSP
ncbi:glucose-1-phosphate cytidylyltransferase [Leptospira kmetyi]|uniref:Glucose-1-phosphate cytidylyltransferase n=1 Tax=Leptospira kmetyi TaxID=408139 RepID=A0ABX4N2X0_9LEPT|nr:glucose-1-phosphate cytidylyltransferase [Leptospira kmetyi]EQA54375.1 glucose-1-phosphate cytidylyltransferase [Leptospira kmetyi serovar Malaysia str. Bejo-Iso9]PJZ27787.1 glucose-1-phosphate cytidylyltransferase [Leptospira kmetyi]